MNDALDARDELRAGLEDVGCGTDADAAKLYRDRVLPAMRDLRAAVDAMELLTPSECWPYPSYGDMLFSVK